MNRRHYLRLLSEQIRYKRALPMVIKEIEAHIEDQKSEFLAEGMTEQEAEIAAVQEMGDPVEVGVELDQIHRPKIAWRVLLIVAALSIVGLVLQGIVELSADYTAGNRLYDLLAGDTFKCQILCIVVGSVLMACICRMNYTVIGRYAVLFWGVMVLALGWYCAVTPPVNGGYYLAWSGAYLLIPVYAGIVWHFRDQGRKGLIKSAVILIATGIFVMYAMVGLSAAGMIMVAGLVILQAAIVWGYFGGRKKGNTTILWVIMLVVPAFLAIWHVVTEGRLLTGYQWERISAILMRGQSPAYQYIASGIDTIVRNPEAMLSVPADSPDMVLLKGDYLWLYLSKYLGNGAGILLTLAEAAFVMVLLILSLRQKNQLGRLLGIGCASFLALQIICYVGMNLGNVGSTSVYMPFLSYGNRNLLVTYLYVGIVLSVHYNSSLIESV